MSEHEADSDANVEKKVRHLETGYEVTVTSKRGTGTYNNDKVEHELRTTTPPTDAELDEMSERVAQQMNQLRENQPDEE